MQQPLVPWPPPSSNSEPTLGFASLWNGFQRHQLINQHDHGWGQQPGTHGNPRVIRPMEKVQTWSAVLAPRKPHCFVNYKNSVRFYSKSDSFIVWQSWRKTQVDHPSYCQREFNQALFWEGIKTEPLNNYKTTPFQSPGLASCSRRQPHETATAAVWTKHRLRRLNSGQERQRSCSP